MMKFLPFFFCITLFFTAHTVDAQIGVPDASIEITSSPRFPEPNNDVRLTLNAYSLDMSGATIRWEIDGVAMAAANNQRSLTVVSGDINTSMSISAKITTKNNKIVETVYKLQPTRVDIIIEANTLTPVFYKGRALPSVGSEVTAIAIPLVGANTNEDQLSYTWKLNNKVLGGGSIIGQAAVTFTMPIGREAALSLEVATSNGVLVAGKNIIISASEPELYFYPDNPLRALSRIAIGSEFFHLGKEIDIRAEPYFVDKNIFEKNPLVQWEVDGSVVQNQNNDLQILTLRNQGDIGIFKISFHIRNLKALVQGVEDSFLLRF